MIESKIKYNKVMREIEKAKNIVVFRHQMPDFDALGSQYGLYCFLKENFKDKNIMLTGCDHVVFSPRLYPSIKCINDEEFPSDFLAIILDTGNTKRIDDQRFLKAKKIIKFDHHPGLENYGDINIVHDELSSCGELIADFLFAFEKKYKITAECAKYLYSAIVGDSGRFLFSSVNPTTLRISAKLLEYGFDKSKDVYLKMYQKTYHDLEITKFVLNRCVFLNTGVAYYILKDEDLKELNITPERGKENLSLMSNLEDIEVWMSITEIKEKGEFKVSIRSKLIPINDIANNYNGGGHDLASGATIYNLSELDNLINDLNKRIAEYKGK